MIPSGDQIWNLFKWRVLVAKFLTNASGGQICNFTSGAIWWPNLEPLQAKIQINVSPGLVVKFAANRVTPVADSIARVCCAPGDDCKMRSNVLLLLLPILPLQVI